MPGASFWLEWIDDPRYYQPTIVTHGEEPPAAGDDPSKSGQAIQDGPLYRKKQPQTPAQKGVWLLVNTTENVYEYARNAGNFREEVWGDVNETYVGSENPPPGGIVFPPGLDSDGVPYGTKGHKPPSTIGGRNYHMPGTGESDRATPPWVEDNHGIVRSNPHIIEKTWARRIDSYTETEGCHVPTIREYTFADDIESHTGSFLHPVGRSEETSYFGTSVSHTQAGVVVESSVVGKSFTNTAVGVSADLTEAVGIGELTLCGGHVEVEICAATHISVEASSTILDIALHFGKVRDRHRHRQAHRLIPQG